MLRARYSRPPHQWSKAVVRQIGKKFKKAELMPKAFQVVFAGSLYHDPEEEVISIGLFSSPEHADK